MRRAWSSPRSRRRVPRQAAGVASASGPRVTATARSHPCTAATSAASPSRVTSTRKTKREQRRSFVPLRFSGRYHDRETELFENWNRYYEPSTGRYLQPEPLQETQPKMAVQASYSYARSNPLAGSKPKRIICADWGLPELGRGSCSSKTGCGLQALPVAQTRHVRVSRHSKAAAPAMCVNFSTIHHIPLPISMTFQTDRLRSGGKTEQQGCRMTLSQSIGFPWSVFEFRINSASALKALELARTLVHEGAHACHEVTGKAIPDLGLFCTAHDIEAICFEN